MVHISDRVEVYIEVGAKRTFAAANDWPGWARSGRDETAALTALADYGARYARAIAPARLGFHAPQGMAEFSVVEWLKGTTTTDFGAPDASPASDRDPLRAEDVRRAQVILNACWLAFDKAARFAAGRELTRGPRGGGRDLDAIVRHILEAEAAYLGRLGSSFRFNEHAELQSELRRMRAAALAGLAAAACGGIPARGPRGGLRWRPRFFVRRVAWHLLDHAWEIEDRSK
ncbi:MAG: hypothetical protein A2Z30_07410 [Chloroflexi bacterium RBG_16_64_43]|nr:MAG: hypothetical protein A2Z30_07410 [Chloroflexi bacterium RBG_16_64_43]